jgi:hypothetical protein
MRSTIAVISAVALLVVQIPSGYAQNAGVAPKQPVALTRAQPVALTRAQDEVDKATPSAAIVEAFKAFPGGGDLLSRRLADIVVNEPKLAVGLVKHVKTAALTKEQKLAAERGLAQALNRLGVKAADMPVKALPVAEPDYTWLLGLLLVPAIICLGLCRKHHEECITPGLCTSD